MGQFVSGMATNAEGIPVNYKTRFKLPSYEGGLNGFSKFLSQTIRYPAVDRENYIQGTVQIKFTITKYGELADIKILKPVSVAINAEAVRVLKLSAGFWETAIAYGRPIDYFLVVPIAFHLQN
jgi:TonB family protein